MIIWCDLETSGLDEKNDSILEAAFVVTDDDLNELDHMEIVVRPVGGISFMMAHMDQFVIDMHTKNGLLGDITKKGVRRYEAEEQIKKFLSYWMVQSPVKVPMAGSTVGFDRAFLKNNMPDVEAAFHYRSIDISSLNELVSRWKPGVWIHRPSVGTESAHRALPDIRHSIETARYYRKELGL